MKNHIIIFERRRLILISDQNALYAKITRHGKSSFRIRVKSRNGLMRNTYDASPRTKTPTL